MAHFTGKDLYITYNGTVITGDQRSLSVSESVDTAETSAGADVGKSYLPTLEDVTFSMEVVDDGTAGSAIYAALESNTGTLVYGPLGTAADNPKYSCEVVVTSRGKEYPYDGEVTRSYEFNRSGDWIEHYEGLGSVWS